MAAAGTVQVRCPACGVALPITMMLKSPTREGDKMIANIEPDLTDVIAHAWTHEPADETNEP